MIKRGPVIWSLTVGYFSDAVIQVERKYMVVLQYDNSHRLVVLYHSGSVGKIRLGAVTLGRQCRYYLSVSTKIASAPSFCAPWTSSLVHKVIS